MRHICTPTVLSIFLSGVILTGCHEFFPDQMDAHIDRSSLNFPQTQYDVKLKGIDDPFLKTLVEENAQLFRLKDKPPVSTNALRYRAQEDVDHIQQALIAHGFYEATTHFFIKHMPDKKIVILKINPGPRYQIDDFVIEGDDQDPESIFSRDKLERVLNINPGEDVDYAKAFEASLRLQRYFKNHGYPFVIVQDPEVVINQVQKKIVFYFNVSLKGIKKFGPVSVIGQTHLKEEYIRNRIAWKNDDLYDERLLEKTKRKLIESELFSGVFIRPIDSPQGNPTALVPIQLEIKEGPPRVIGGGIKYAIQDKFSVRTYWNHKNFLGAGQRLGAIAQYGQRESFIQATFDIPDLLAANFDLLTKVRAKYEITEAYRGASYYTTGKLKHQYNDQFAYYFGTDYEFSHLKREGKTYKRQFTGIPVGVIIDTSNDPINPIKGGKLELEMAPYFGQFNQDNKMLRLRGRAIHYLRLIKKDTFIIASWIRTGAIYFARGSEIPLNKRFYSGGAGSVRGYGYQLLGPVDRDRKPEGGRGLLEFGIEPRIHFSEKFGLSTFFEGGSVTKTDTPNIKGKNFLYGVGIGAKYYTEIGPFRLDFAVPLKRRTIRGKRVDAPFQVYVSIGQAF